MAHQLTQRGAACGGACPLASRHFDRRAEARGRDGLAETRAALGGAPVALERRADEPEGSCAAGDEMRRDRPSGLPVGVADETIERAPADLPHLDDRHLGLEQKPQGLAAMLPA